jgi:hypothetical protein
VLSTVSFFGWGQAVELSGSLAVVSTGSSLVVVDVSDPRAPAERGRSDLGEFALDFGLDLWGSRAFIVGRGLRVVDLSSPASPAIAGGIQLPASVSDVDVVGVLAFAVGNRGLLVVDVSNETTPRELGRLETGGFVRDVEVVGSLAYLAEGEFDADSTGRLRVVDVSDPTAPVAGQAVEIPYIASQVEVSEGLALVNACALHVLDLSVPELPVGLGALDGICADEMEASGGLAFPLIGGMPVIDLSDPSAPAQIGHLSFLFDFALGLAARGDRVYTASRNGLRVIDVSQPSVPRELGSLAAPASEADVAVVGDTAYLVGSGAGFLRVIDLSDESAPVQIGGLERQATARDVEAGQGVIYALAWPDAVDPISALAIDVSDPTHPVELGGLETDDPQNLKFADGLLYVADGAAGLRILDFGPEYRGGYAPGAVVVGVDVQPGSRRNMIRPRARRVRVALLGSERFDVAAVDVASLRFGPGQAPPDERILVRDVNRDGFADLISRHAGPAAGIEPSQSEACVHGRLLDGTRFDGCDAVTPRGR